MPRHRSVPPALEARLLGDDAVEMFRATPSSGRAKLKFVADQLRVADDASVRGRISFAEDNVLVVACCCMRVEFEVMRCYDRCNGTL